MTMHHRHPYRAEQDPSRTRRPHCRKCGQPIVWVKSAKSNKVIPCEPPMIYGDGEKTLILFTGQMVQKAPASVIGREVHFGRVCPEGLLDAIASD